LKLVNLAANPIPIEDDGIILVNDSNEKGSIESLNRFVRAPDVANNCPRMWLNGTTGRGN
jgi:hypothetical protein